MKIDNIRLIFFGSDQFSIRVLGNLLKGQICPVEVVTRPNTTLDKFAITNKLKRYPWPCGIQNSQANQHDIGLVASFGSLIGGEVVRSFKYGLFNVHPSLLPKYRGSTPIQMAVFDGIKETGCTIMRISPVPKFDIGDIVLQEKLKIKDREFALDLRDRLADLGAQLSTKLLLDYEVCLANARPQDNSMKSVARKLKPEQGQLQFRTDSSDLIDRKVRAFTGFIELHIFCLQGLQVRLEGMVDPDEVEQYRVDQLVLDLLVAQECDKRDVIAEGIDRVPAGTMYFHKLRRHLCIKASDDRWMAFKLATPAHKSQMSALDFYNGYLSKIPQRCRITDS